MFSISLLLELLSPSSSVLKAMGKYFLKLILWRKGEKEGRGRGRERGRERRYRFVAPLFMHSLVDSCMCSNLGSNLQPWGIRTMPYPTELPGQGQTGFILVLSINYCIIFYSNNCKPTFLPTPVKHIKYNTYITNLLFITKLTRTLS